MGFGIVLKNILKERNISVSDLARKTGINKYTLYTTIRRDSTRIDPGFIADIAVALDIPIEEMLARVGIRQTPYPERNILNIDDVVRLLNEMVREYDAVSYNGRVVAESELAIIEDLLKCGIRIVKRLIDSGVSK